MKTVPEIIARLNEEIAVCEQAWNEPDRWNLGMVNMEETTLRWVLAFIEEE